MRCAPYEMHSSHVLFRPHGFAKASAQQPTGLLGLLIPLLFLGIVRRFPFGKLHGHYVFAGIRLSRCPRFEEVL